MSVHAQDCLFCRLIRGELPCVRVFENDHVFAFLDINPVNKGHILVVPREHAETIFDVPSLQGSILLEAIQRIGRAVMRATGAQGLNVMQNNYKAAGQEVGHVHWHLIPRHLNDGHTPWTHEQYADEGEMRTLADAVRQYL